MDGSCYEVVEMASKGRGVIAACDITKGTLIMSCEPYLTFLDDYMDACSWCLMDHDPSKPAMRRVCQTCKTARWCSERCQVLAKRSHDEVECAVMKQMKQVLSPQDEDWDDMLCVCLTEKAEEGRKDFMTLCFQKQQDVGKVARLTKKVEQVLGRPCTLSVEETLGRHESNAFGIDCPFPPGESTESGEPDVNYIGRAVYPKASFFNHACEANVFRVRHHRTLFFIASCDIPKGMEMTITYIATQRHDTANERMAILFRDYGFHCDCRLCQLNTVPTLQNLCSRCGCLIHLDNKCSLCQAEVIYNEYF